MYFARLNALPFSASSNASVALRSLLFDDRLLADFPFSFFGFAIQHTLSSPRLDIQANQHTLGVGEIADDLSDRLRQFPHERRDGKDLIAARQRRVFHQIDDFNVILTFQILFANLFQILKGGERARRLARDIKAQIPAIAIVVCLRQ